MLVGPNLLVAPVFEQGATTRTLRLPRDDATPGWRCYHTGTWYPGGATVTVEAPLDRLPLFVRAGAVVPTTDAADGSRRTDEPSRALRLYPAPPGIDGIPRISDWIEDDGVTERWKRGALARIRCTLEGDDRALRLVIVRDGAYALPCDRVRIVLPHDETRDVSVDGASLGVRVVR
jgi:alpha-glucosidase